MPRSPLTLAAAITSALPAAVVVSVATLTEHAEGRFDSAVATLDSGQELVIRVAGDDEAAAQLHDATLALRALTDGVRAHLPFTAPQVHGEGVLDGHRFLVLDRLPGYRVDAGRVPAGGGVAPELGAAIAAVHALPASVVRRAALPALTAEQSRSEVSRLLDRVSASHRVPVSLLARWSRAVAADPLWLFEPSVVLGGVDPDAFLFVDEEGRPRLRGLLEWGGLAVGDPARDLHWLSSAPEATGDVLQAYARGLGRTPEDALHVRARLYAELEFARWLVHGHDHDREDIVDDAAQLLTALAENVVDDDLLADDERGIDEAIALIGQVPTAPRAAADTSMQTDAYDGDSMFTDGFDAPAESGADEPTVPWSQTDVLGGEDGRTDTDATTGSHTDGGFEQVRDETSSTAREPRADGDDSHSETDPDATAAAREASRASEAALRRWSAREG